MLLFGFMDDLKPSHWSLRVVSQIFASILIISILGFDIKTIGSFGPFHEISLGIFSLPITLIAIVGLTNSINLLDGIDGLAASQVLIVVLYLIIKIDKWARSTVEKNLKNA